ncbi:MAG: hydroxyacid dehydrogenase [Acidobacteria bacterium 13_1_40CM_65_14]|nr:MAG: hydroxyacid dehydrogenase [Acidobacteria bacterium 13_1_40CM_65_14]OLC80045.1 MAG: hydroxyacid dehydrogenase [Acidobacteria bacterium 13_1_40CM_4_65_8]
MKVLVADKFEKSGIDGLKAAGCDIVYEPDLKDDALTQAIKNTGADVLVVRSTAVTAPMLESGALSLVVRAGAGYNTIDVATASKRGIYVSNCPGKNAIAVAELAFALLLALDRRVPDNVADLRAGTWNKKEYSKAKGLFGRTLGLLGYGNIGQEMAKRAHAFGMPIVVWSRRFASGKENIADAPIAMQMAKSPEEVAERSDVLSVHLALTPETRGLVSASVIDKLKPGSYFVNTARAEVVDYAALDKAVRERNIRVGLDVFAGEPSGATGEFRDALASHPSVYGTHHIGASTDQAQEAIAAETVRIIASYKDTGKVPNVVNLAKKTPATHMLVVRHRDRPGVLAHVFDHLRNGDINVQETENVIFEGAQAAVARINLDGAPPDALLKTIQEGNGDILDLHLVTI